MNVPDRPLIIYQDSCRFCRAAARFVARLDRGEELALLGYENPVTIPFRAEIPPADFERSWQLLMPDGRRLQSGEAGIELMRLIPRTRRLGRALASLRMTRLVGLVYVLVSRNRPLLGHLVRNAPGPHRPPQLSVGEET